MMTDVNATTWLPYTQMANHLPPLEVVQGKGSVLSLKNGQTLIDAVSSWWTVCHGYSHPHLVQALTTQAKQLSHVMLGGLIHPQTARLSQRLSALLPGDLSHIFYSESGSVSVEVALKMCLQYWLNQDQAHKNRFVFFEHGYHGDTLYAMSVCDPEQGMHRLFAECLPPQYFQTLPDTEQKLNAFENWLKQHHTTVAGVIIEPLVQGAGGMKMYDSSVLAQIAQLCEQYDVLLIVDEIFTGFGRTGTFFAIEQAGMVPDIVCLSKALTGGMLPMAATVTNQRVYQAFLDTDPQKALMHGGTYMGNPLGCAVANASLDLFEQENRLTQVAQIQDWLTRGLEPLQQMAGVKAVRVKGAIGVIQLDQAPDLNELNHMKQQFIDQGIWCRPFGDIIYTTPSFTIEQQQLMAIIHAMEQVLIKRNKMR